MHELGHTLGLGHGGGGTENCKPNYLSVMSYLFQTSGLQRAAPGSPTFFDYSRDAYPTTAGVLIENALDENIGIEDDDFLTFFGPPINADGIDNGPTPDGDLTDDLIMAIGTGPIDWDQNNASDDNPAAPTDINFAERTGCGGAGGTPDPAPDDDLAGHVDWDALQYNFRTSSTFEDGEHGDRPEDMDFETSESFKEAIWRARATRLFRYDAKILCGTQTDPDGLRLTQGRYGTVVNILNPGRRNARLRKSLALAYPPEEQLPGETFPISMDDLEPEHALKVDCEDVRRNVFDGSFPAPWIDGFVTVLSSEPLVVHGVYTTSAVDSEGVARGHSSIEIERYSGVDLSSDLRTRKRAAFLPIEIFDNYAINVVLFEITVTNEGPADALDVRLDDTLRLFQSGGVVSVLMVPEQPADFPQGGSISVTQESPDLAEVRFVMGDIQNGSTRLARFLALVPTYRIAGATPPAVALVDTAEADFAGYEADPLDNSGTAIVELLP